MNSVSSRALAVARPVIQILMGLRIGGFIGPPGFRDFSGSRRSVGAWRPGPPGRSLVFSPFDEGVSCGHRSIGEVAGDTIDAPVKVLVVFFCSVIGDVAWEAMGLIAQGPAMGTSDGSPRSYRFGYGVLDENLNGQVDPGEKRVYFEISDFATSYIFHESPR